MIQVTCECGAKLKAEDKHAGRRAVCPYCGAKNRLLKNQLPTAGEVVTDVEVVQPPEEQVINAELVDEYLDPPNVAPRIDTSSVASARAASSAKPAAAEPSEPWLEVFLENLLSPRSIRWMFVFGGGLMVLGIVIWLSSLGVFEDPTLVAGALTLGSLAVYGIGLAVALMTEKKMIGQAVTFLGCVLLPLNLWYYHAQGLMTLDGSLWVGGAACTLVYVITLFVLRDPLFVYAVEVGVTLTAVLILGNVGLIDQSPAFSILFMVLAVLSIHAELLGTMSGDEKRAYGMPFFWCGQVQLAASISVLFVVQVLGWFLSPLQEVAGWTWSGNLLTESSLATAGLWIMGAYLYFYSDIAVRKIGIYAFAGAFCLLMTEATLASMGELAVEWRMAILSGTALAVALIFQMVAKTHEAAARYFPPCVLLLSAPSVFLGLGLHIRATSAWAGNLSLGYESGWELMVSMLFSAVCARICAAIFEKTDRAAAAVFLFLSAAGLAGAFAALFRVAGIVEWTEQAPPLMLIPLGYIIAVHLERGRPLEHPLGWVAHTAAALILLGTLLEAVLDLGMRLDADKLLKGTQENLILGLVFAEGTLFYFLAARSRQKSENHVLAAISGGAAVWQLLVFVHVPVELLGPLFAAIGLGLVLYGRKLGVSTESRYSAGGWLYTAETGPGRRFHLIGNGLLVWAWVVGWVGNIAAYSQSETGSTWIPISSMILCAGLAAVAAFAAAGKSWRTTHWCFAALLIITGAFQIYLLLDLNPWQLVEYSIVGLGAALLIPAVVGRLYEKDGKENDSVTMGLFLGSVFVAPPLLIGLIYHRFFGDGIFLPDEFGFLTATIALLVVGVMFQLKSPVFTGGVSLGAYLIVLLVSLFYIPQLAIGVYLAVGGGLLFTIALVLSMFRERIVQMPQRFAEREGLFQLLRWR